MDHDSVTWPAMARYKLDPAPGGLGFVHDLLGTAPAGKPRQPDLLADAAMAQDWLDAALAGWASVVGRTPARVALSARDTAALRRFRDALRQQISLGQDGDMAGRDDGKPLLPLLAVTLGPDASGQIRAEPRGSGWRAAAAVALIEIFQAQHDGTWQRLKICRNQRCEGAFYDRSRNNSGVWHDVHACGNQANLRAYRARQRSKEQP